MKPLNKRDLGKLINGWRCRPSEVGRFAQGMTKGLTESQGREYRKLQEKEQSGKKLTELQAKKYKELKAKKNADYELSSGGKSYAKEVFLQILFGVRKDIKNKYLIKGVEVEGEVLQLIGDVMGYDYSKNEEFLQNDYMQGTPDFFDKNYLLDAKSSWDLFTFPFFETKADNGYMWQLKSYAVLINDTYGYVPKKVLLGYGLVDTPESLIIDEIYRASREYGAIDLPEYMEQEIRKRMTYNHLPKSLRVKLFDIDVDVEQDAEIIKKGVELMRKEMANLLEIVEL